MRVSGQRERPFSLQYPRRAAEATGGELSLAARSLGWLFVAGAGIGLLSLLLPHPPHAEIGQLYSNVGLAFAGGVGLLVGAQHVRYWHVHVALVAGALLITRAVVLSGEAVSFYSAWFIWVGLYAFNFFSRSRAAAHVAFAACLYAFTLARQPPTSPVARWLTTVMTLVVAGVFIDTLVRRARRQADAAASTARSMARVAEVAHELAALSDAGAGRIALCRGAVRVTDALAVTLWEPSGDASGLRMTARAGVAPDEEVLADERPAGGPEGVFATGELAMSRSAVGRPRSNRTGPDPHTDSALLWQPIRRDGATIGVLELCFEDAAALDDPAALALADLLGVEVAVTLQRFALLARLEAIARTDELTGLLNRRAWQERLPLELARAKRDHEPMTVAMLDLDHFKAYNDSWGHQSGDQLLKQIAAVWSAELRPTDILVRYGGEEFALAQPGCSTTEALLVVGRLRAVVPHEQSCSVGVASWDGTESPADLLDRADNALYQAKRSGRDQTIVAGPKHRSEPAEFENSTPILSESPRS